MLTPAIEPPMPMVVISWLLIADAERFFNLKVLLASRFAFVSPPKRLTEIPAPTDTVLAPTTTAAREPVLPSEEAVVLKEALILFILFTNKFYKKFSDFYKFL